MMSASSTGGPTIGMPSGYNDNWGVGIRFFVMGSPLRLDYGIPLTTDRFNNEGGAVQLLIWYPVLKLRL